MDIERELKEIIKGTLRSDQESLRRASRDASLFEVTPSVLVEPEDTDDIIALVNFIAKNKKKNPGLSITARAAGTDMTGGPLSESVVLDMTKHFTGIGEVKVSDDGTSGEVWVEPGVYYRDFEKATLKHNLIMPTFPASRELCTIGGMVANNAGGEKTLLYGKTAEFVAELKVIFRDGKEYTVRPLTKGELEEKMRGKSFEAEVYKKMYQLVSKNAKLLGDARPKVSKNSAGYALWDIWDGQTFDATRLITGSQGTLGIITKIKFRLVRPHEHSRMLVIFLKDITSLGRIVNKVLEEKPEAFESYDDHTLKLALKFIPQFIKLLKGNAISAALKFLPELRLLLLGGFPRLVLTAEFTGDSEADVIARASRAERRLKEFHLPTRITRSASEAEKYKLIRRESFNLLRHKIKGKQTAPFIDDIIVRPEQLSDFLPKLRSLLEEYDMIYTIAGHIGDANFHIIPLLDLSDKKSREMIPEIASRVYDLVFSFGGSMTAEHNDGLIRTPYLKDMFGERVYLLFEEMKSIFDPDAFFNPRKKVGGSFKYAVEHFKKGA